MERDFRYLRDKFGDVGARDVFEKYALRYILKSLVKKHTPSRLILVMMASTC